MSDQRTENAKTLASLLGIAESEAAKRLDLAVAITFDRQDAGAVRLAEMLALILGRTISTVRRNDQVDGVAAEVVIGAAVAHRPRSPRLVVSASEFRMGHDLDPAQIHLEVHPLLLLVAACYASARVLKILFEDQVRVSALATADTLVVPHSVFTGKDPTFLSRSLRLADTYMAGAGAIGNGVAFALSLLDVSGNLTILDPDTVSSGNLNRCLLFTEADIDEPKATRLATVLNGLCPRLQVTGSRQLLQDFGKEMQTAKWLHRLIVAVDSPRGRRQLQSEVPGEVFDASTTGVEEVVFHHHRQPTTGACLACVYHETPNENAHELHIAEQLGLDLADVQAHFITDDSASKILKRYPDLSHDDLVGQAVDSLFKALCGEAKLQTPEGRQVLAPFAFVSVLASVILVIELMRRSIDPQPSNRFNHWRVSPWMPPVEQLQRVLPRRHDCEFCREPALLRAAARLWS